MNQVVLVDSDDRETGVMELLGAHAGKGVLHRAVSVVVFRIAKSGTEILLQKRSEKKLLWPGIWSNTVCTHPAPGEATLDAGVRRLREEMGITVPPVDLRYVMKIQYQAPFGDTHAENELDTVYLARFSGLPVVNPHEVAEYKWMEITELITDQETNVASYTPWFRLILARERFRDALRGNESV